MRIWFDTEFIEDGKTIDLISIGLVREDGRKLYAENAECDLSKACPWVQANVITHLVGNAVSRSRAVIAKSIIEFAGSDPEFWAWYGAYDWVVLCQLYGRMIDLPQSWPMFVRDLRQLLDNLQGHDGFALPPKPAKAHNALEDAIWTKDAWEHAQSVLQRSAHMRPVTEVY